MFNSLKLRPLFAPLRSAVDSTLGSIASRIAAAPDRQATVTAIAAIFATVLRHAAADDQQQLAIFRDALHDSFGAEALIPFYNFVHQPQDPDLGLLVAPLLAYPEAERLIILDGVIRACLADRNYSTEEKHTVHLVGQSLKFSEELITQREMSLLKEFEAQQKLVLSWAGLVAALAIFAVFLLAAVYLKSILIGLTLAYFCLPLQNRFTALLNRPSFSWLRPSEGRSLGTLRHSREEQLAGTACTLTVITIFSTLLLGLGLLSWFSYSLISEWRAQQPPAAISQNAFGTQSPDLSPAQSTDLSPDPSPAQSTDLSSAQSTDLSPDPSPAQSTDLSPAQSTDPSQPGTDLFTFLDTHLHKLADKTPFARQAHQAASRLLTELRNEQNQRELATKAVEAGGGILGSLKIAGSWLLGTLLDILLGFFFFVFFLRKMALFSIASGSRSIGTYIADTFFKSSWMPRITASTLQDTARLIDEVCLRLQVWVRGCFWIIIVEIPVFCGLFSFLGVPYAIPIGVLSSMCVLLPIIGPILVIALNLGLCIIHGHTDPVFLLEVLACHVVITYIIEGFILYPRLVGHRLGLSFLETVIVVILGALMAGVTGAIFAVPAASVLKFVLPRIFAILKAPAVGKPGPAEGAQS